MKWALLDGVPEDDVRALLSIARRRKFARGEVVFHEGDPADTLHLIDKGRFAVRTQTALGDTAILAVLGSGEMFGELALLDVASRSRAAPPCRALEAGETPLRAPHGLRAPAPRAPGDDVGAHRDPAPARCGGSRATCWRRSTSPPTSASCAACVEVAALYDDGVVPLTQEDLAGLAGTSRATVNRVLREEEARGTVKLGRGRTSVLDADALDRRGR